MAVRPVYDAHVLAIARVLKREIGLFADLQTETGLSRHYVQRCLQYMMHTGCVEMRKRKVPGQGWIGFYVLRRAPVLPGDKRTPRGPGKPPKVQPMASSEPALTLWQAWPMPVLPLPKLQDCVVSRLEI